MRIFTFTGPAGSGCKLLLQARLRSHTWLIFLEFSLARMISGVSVLEEVRLCISLESQL